MLVALAHSRSLGVFCDEDRVVNMGASNEEVMNSPGRGDVHGCRRFFTMPVYVLFGDISMYPHDKKIGQCHATT